MDKITAFVKKHKRDIVVASIATTVTAYVCISVKNKELAHVSVTSVDVYKSKTTDVLQIVLNFKSGGSTAAIVTPV